MSTSKTGASSGMGAASSSKVPLPGSRPSVAVVAHAAVSAEKVHKAAEDSQRELAQVKAQLSELIDEVLFAEAGKTQAEGEATFAKERAGQLEYLLQNLLMYITQVETAIILPSLGELMDVLPADVNGQRVNALACMTKLQNVEPATAKQILQMKAPNPTLRHNFQRMRDDIMRMQTSETTLEEALLLCKTLVKSKEVLMTLLEDTTNNVKALLPQQTGGSIRPTLRASQDAEAREEIEALRSKIAAVTAERDTLVSKAQSSTTYESLQAQYYSEQNRLQGKNRELEERCQRLQTDYDFAQNELEESKRSLQQALHEKAVLSDELNQFRSGRKTPVGGATPASGASSAAANENHKMRLEMDSLVREHSTVVTRLEGQNAQLRMEVAELRGQVKAGTSVDQHQQLQKTNEMLRREVSLLQQRLLSSSSNSASESHLDGKIQAFEITISSLNTELAHVEAKISNVERSFAEERRKLVASFDAERQRYQQERDECDSLVLKMTNELELLVRENTALKSQRYT
jgi:chromosome segregation ATPase